MGRISDWINRQRHNRGYGVQSPSAFFFVTQVLKERLPYYAYPILEEIAKEVGIPKEDIVYAMDAIQNPMSLYEPIFTDGGDTLYVMDQISDKKNKEENWIENLSLTEAMKHLDQREREIRFTRLAEWI